MKIKTKSNLLIAILTFTTILGVFALTIGTAWADDDDDEPIIVVPSGGNDTDAIQAAFDAAGPGHTVQLAEGDFYTDNIIVENFCGRFRGAGIGLTTIDVYDEVTPDPINGMTALFKFDGGDIHISDLSFDIAPDTPYLDDIIWLTGAINSKIEYVKFTGYDGLISFPWAPGISWNVFTAMGITGISEIPDGYTTGEHSITNCVFDSVGMGIDTWGLVDGELKVAENSFTGGHRGIRTQDTVNSEVKISHNSIECFAFASICVVQMFHPAMWPASWPIESLQCSITYNYLYTFGEADGMLLIDFMNIPWVPWATGETSLEAAVSHNHITLDNEMYGGIVMWGLADSLISKNTITGVGDYGFSCEDCNNLNIRGNYIKVSSPLLNPDPYFYGIGLLFCSDNVIAFNSISHEERDGISITMSSENLILGNLIINNGEYGLNLVDSNDNRIYYNVFYNNAAGNINDDGTNIYKRNWEF